MNPDRPKVSGSCPMGCGQTLVLDGERVVCRAYACDNPTAAHEVLTEVVTFHMVRFYENDTYSVIHPLRERIEVAGIGDCHLNFYLRDRSGPPVGPGLYRADRRGQGRWVFARVGD